MKGFLSKIKKEAAKNPKRIGFPEGEEDIILKAVKSIKKQKIASVVLIGKKNKIKRKAKKLKLSLNDIEIIEPNKNNSEILAKKLYKLRKSKGLTLNKAKKLIKDNMYFTTMLLHQGKIDGIVSGARHSTAETLRPALKIIKCKKSVKKVSGLFLIPFKNKILFFADTAVQISPNKKELAEIAMQSAKTAMLFKIEPRVALLSFSTHGSAKHKKIEKIKSALKIVQNKMPKLKIDGELQADAALLPEVAKIKTHSKKIQGNANVLIFPNLESANIGYKLAKIFGDVQAIGPVIQGLKKPVNDLSRGCNVKEIINTTAITVIQAQNLKNEVN